ncbi:homeobox KN domain-containing protein [Daldinia bambusicola]|nr:homeobox KN domain-containing protein [Daldinia bambusicola]
MSTMTIYSPYNSGLSRELHRVVPRPEPSSREGEKVSLPSIRQAFPDFERQLQQDFAATTRPSVPSPARRSFSGEITPPEYTHSSVYYKRNFEDGRDTGRTISVPRLCTSSSISPYRSASPPPGPRTDIEAWKRSTPTYRPSGYHHGYHHPNRVQSLSVGSTHPFDRPSMYSPVHSPVGYGHQYHDSYMPVRDIAIGGHYEAKQRKRRGNLPKETTDKLRAWFHSHLSHPYPTEEEKQQLMKQTGLQMNQISNWFINARRRQLPNMISNARAETDAMTVRVAEKNLLPSTERNDYDADGRLLSDEDVGAPHDVQLESFKRRRVTGINRGSI